MIYRASGIRWRQYAAITVDATGWGGGAVDAEITIPRDLEAFWSLIDNSAAEARVLSPDLGTVLTYKITTAAGATFDATAKSNRDGKISIDNWTPPAAAMCRLVLAWHATGASSAASVLTTSSPLTGYIATGLPRVGWRAKLERPGATQPSIRLQKTATEVLRVYVDASGLIQGRQGRMAGPDSTAGALRYASYTVDTGGASQAGMKSATSLRFLGESTMFFLVQAGTSGTDYTINASADVVHTDGTSDTINPRAMLRVRSTTEA